MRISDWSSDVCSSDLPSTGRNRTACRAARGGADTSPAGLCQAPAFASHLHGGERPYRRVPGAAAPHSRCGGGNRTDPVRGHMAGGRRRKPADRTSVGEGKRGSVGLDLGGRRINKKKKTVYTQRHNAYKKQTRRTR